MSTRQNLFGLAVDALTMDAAVARCVAAADAGERLEVGVVNAAKIVAMRSDRQLAESVAGCGLILADGQSVVWASRVLRKPLPERVAGIDLFLRLLREAERLGLSVYFLGAREEVLARMLAELRRRFPALIVAGSRNGYFAEADAASVAEEIAGSVADFLFLGMTSPKKENFVAAHGPASAASVMHGVGGSFDIVAGITKRAPERWQRLGMEWLFRLLQEPRRLGKRYATTNLTFVGLVLRDVLHELPRSLS